MNWTLLRVSGVARLTDCQLNTLSLVLTYWLNYAMYKLDMCACVRACMCVCCKVQ